MNNYIVLLIFLPCLFLIFMFTKASFIQFLLGFGLCLLGQTILVICYCIVKTQQALMDSTRIKLQENYSLNVEKQFPFRERKENLKIFLNKFTEEEKLQTKKNTLKVQSFQNHTSQQEILSQQPKKQMLKFLRQKHFENSMYNFFNKLLINFGKELSKLSQPSQLPLLPNKYTFQTFQQHSVSQIPQHQLQNSQRQLLDELDIKIKIKKDQHQHIILPQWSTFISGLKSIGHQFTKIEEMHDCNKEIITMVNSKIIEDFQFIESEIKKSLRSLDEIQKTSLQLKKQNEQFLKGERNVTQHQMDLIFLLKQHYYKFQDFQLRIKENQKNYHLQVKRLSYFRQKLQSFSRKNKQKYQKIFKTRFFAILDSYNITIQQSIKSMRKVLAMSHSLHECKPPKVNRLQTHKNVDQQIQAEQKYQQEYFERVEFYHQRSEEMVRGMRDLEGFLGKLQKVFGNVVKGLEGFGRQICNTPEYSKNFTTILIVKFSQMIQKMHSQTSHLLTLHSTFTQRNQPYLLVSQNRTLSAIHSASQLLSSLHHPDQPLQPLQHKYKLSKLHLQHQYQSIQSQLQQIKRFTQVYAKHSNRVKKVLMMELLYFLNMQRLYMSESDFMKTLTAEGLWISHNEMGGNRQENQQEKQENIHSPEEVHIDNIYTGQYLWEQYVKVINRFFFSAYSQWKNSQFFKQTLTKQLYILLNKQQNESISQVIIQNLQLTGYPPQIQWIRQLHSEPFEFLADIMIAFKGKLIIYLKTEYHVMGLNVPTEVKVQLQELYCVVRLCFVPSEIGQSWFSFIGEPIAKFTVEPKIYDIKINVETIRNFFSTLLLKKLKESTFPIREKIMIPVSKDDPMLQLIQKRFKSGYNF